jgi:DNA-binding XRE family transcriptional regulator
MADRERHEAEVDPITEAMVRDLLLGRDGVVRLRFRVTGTDVSMEVIEDRAAPEDRDRSFASWMGQLLRTRHLSQEATARKLGVSLKTVNRWVNGRTEPRMRELRKIQEEFGVGPPL